MPEPRLYEDENSEEIHDSEARSIKEGLLVTQPYDLNISTLKEQIDSKVLNLRPAFQRLYIWSDTLASRLIESVLLNIPIPPCYLAQNEKYELDVIDGQQRIFSIYRFLDNQFTLRDLGVLTELNGMDYLHLPRAIARRIETYTLRCEVLTNESDPDFKFEVFERLNTSTVPLNPQELRNSISRGRLIDLLGELVEYPPWLSILNKRQPDNRMRDQEMILRFFGFHINGLEGYHTPQKIWLNTVANDGRDYSDGDIERLAFDWVSTIDKCLLIFERNECFRRLPINKRAVVNRALMDLTMYCLKDVPQARIEASAKEFYQRYSDVVTDPEFEDLITRGIDHTSRTLRRFAIWDEKVINGLF